MMLASRMVQCAIGAGVLIAGSAAGEPVRFDVPRGTDPLLPGWWMESHHKLDLTQSYEDNLFGPTWDSDSTFDSATVDGQGAYYTPREGLSAGPGFGLSKGVLTTPGDRVRLAVPLQYGATIDQSSGAFTRDGLYYDSSRGAVDPMNPFPLHWFFYESSFTPEENSFVGVKFLIDGQVHYGWVEVVLTGSEPVIGTSLGGNLHANVLAWGYETEPGMPAIAGVPAPASVTLIGLAGIGAMRRRRSDHR